MIQTVTDEESSRLQRWLQAEPRRRRFLLALSVYAIASLGYVLFAAPTLLAEHTPYNHFAHLAQAWLDGRLDLADGAPRYARNNDFAVFEDATYVVFPPFPAVLLLPFVALAGSPEAVPDGRIFLGFAGLGPAILFLALERLRDAGQSSRSPLQNFVLALCFAFGTVYFFTAEQGTVWFAAHVVGVVLAAAYLLFSIDARYPVLAGVALGLGFLTRTPLLFAVPFFACEAWRVVHRSGRLAQRPVGLWASAVATWNAADKRRLFALLAAFSIPVTIAVCLTWWHNLARFGDPFEPGYRYLTVAWQARMEKWGLFHYHYLAKNLGVMLTSLPWLDEKVPFRINVHGLALWFTTPLYVWLLWPKARPSVHVALWLTTACVALPTLFYQNTGWAQFGYRFSNDYAVFLFGLLAVGMRPMRWAFGVAAAWSIVVNAFGAATFQRSEYRDFYYGEGSQKILYQPD